MSEQAQSAMETLRQELVDAILYDTCNDLRDGVDQRAEAQDLVRRFEAALLAQSAGPELVRGRVSEYRFVYWTGDPRVRFYSVRRDWEHRSDRWGVFDGDVLAWNGEDWDTTSSRPDSYKWSEKDALEIAERLTIQMNQHIVGVMDKRFPGRQFRGGPYDMLAQRSQ